MQSSRSTDIEENLLPSSSISTKSMKKSINALTEIDYTKRVAIFIVLNIIGMFLTFGSVMRLFFAILTLDASSFALAYTMGNLLSLVAMIVLTGFKAQYESITDTRRFRISAIYFGSMLSCIVILMISTGFVSRILVLSLVIIQLVSYYAFTLSYFPRIRSIIASGLGLVSKKLAQNN